MSTRSAAVLTGLALLAALPAHAGASGAGPSILGQLLFFIPLILIFYFLLIRPQQQQRKRHREMVEAIKRGDTIVTSGGLIGKVTKVGEQELTVELAEGVRVRTLRHMVADVRTKAEPVAAND